MDSDADKVDSVVCGWREALPELDPSALEAVGRVIVLSQHLERASNTALAAHELTLGEFDILGTLRRHGSGGMTPTQLLRWVVLTSGGMTARLTRLEARGLLTRTPDPTDRRGVIVELTKKGRALIDAAAATRFAAAERSLPLLSDDEQKELVRLLRKWLTAVEAVGLTTAQ